MNNLSKAFVASAIFYFAFGTTLGMLILLSKTRSSWGGWDYYLIPTHTHLNLLGWVSMTMFAVGYRAFPAFFGGNLYSMKLAWVHYWCANVGLVGMALFFFLNRLQDGSWTHALAISGTIQLLGVFLFVYNIARSIFTKPSIAEPYHDPKKD